jgi:hypothetical protein
MLIIIYSKIRLVFASLSMHIIMYCFYLVHVYNDLLLVISNCDYDLYDIYTSYSFRLTFQGVIGI